MSHELSLKAIQREWHGTLKAYVIGLIASLLLTSASFFAVVNQIFPKETLIITIVALAIVQAIFQLLFFLHLGQEAKPRWETVIFYFMLGILFIIAIGSLWIMFDLNERVMPNMKEETSHD